MKTKLEKLQQYMTTNQVDLIYLDNPTSVAYFTNFESNPHERIIAYIVTLDDHFLFVPSLEEKEAKEQSHLENVYSYTDDENPWSIIQTEANKITPSIQRIAVEESTLFVDRYFQLQKHFDTQNFSNITSFIENMRVVKSKDEIDQMLLAGRLADEALEIGKNLLKEGITEQEIVAEIDMEMKKRGVTEMSFTTLVLFGEHAASPHGTPGERQLKNNELVLFDLGVIINGYASDVTRMVAFGKPSAKAQELYAVVRKAQETAQAAVKPGIQAGELDRIARKVIEDAGYGQYFTHRLGHGIGKTAHEYPSINNTNETILEEGMCFSIEPGIYIENEIGLRLEDCVYVTSDGCVPFTKTSKDLAIIS